MLILFAGATASASGGQALELNISTRVSGHENYYMDLLSTALAAAGHEVHVNSVGRATYYRQLRMLKNGQISLIWRLATAERDANLLRANVGLTNGLIGQRVLLIPKGDQYRFNKVESLEDFKIRRLVGGFGENWYDIDVWRANDLEALEIQGDVSKIFRMLGNRKRGIDYFSRGVNEVLGELKQYDDLAVEQSLLLVYQREMYFYFHPDNILLKNLVASALQQAKDSGVMAQVVRRHWGDFDTRLALKQRRVLQLQLP